MTVAYKVLTQTPDTQRTAGGAVEHGTTITAQIVGSQSTFRAFVPDSQYTVDQVTAILADKATHVAAVANIGA